MSEPAAPLTAEVRARVLTLASGALGRMGDEAVPRTLRPFARFTPGKRARAAAGALAAALEDDPEFRERVAVTVRDDPLSRSVEAGVLPPAADPVHAAALAYLLRPVGWVELIEQARDVAGTRARSAAVEDAGRQVNLLTERLAGLQAEMREQGRRARAEVARSAADGEALRRELREQVKKCRQAVEDSLRATAEVAAQRQRFATAQSRLEADLRRVRLQLAGASAAAESARRGAREGRAGDDARLWLLLDTLVNAAQGLRRELALSPTRERPADLVVAATGAEGDLPGYPPQVDQLLALPHVHLIIDGYNVTKAGYGDLPLEAQRTRLVSRLGALAAQTGAEVTVAFDGAERLPVAPASPRGVRVLFSQIGETADELIGRLVGAEPPGRVLAVVSSDREVADAARRAGAYAVASPALLGHLERS